MRLLKNKTDLEKNKYENNTNVTLGNETEDNKTENNKLENNRKDISRKKSYCNYEQREYPPEFFEGLYDNLRKGDKYGI